MGEVEDLPVALLRFVFRFGWFIYLIAWVTTPTEREVAAAAETE